MSTNANIGILEGIHDSGLWGLDGLLEAIRKHDAACKKIWERDGINIFRRTFWRTTFPKASRVMFENWRSQIFNRPTQSQWTAKRKRYVLAAWIQCFCLWIWTVQSLLALEWNGREDWLRNLNAEAEDSRCSALKAWKQEKAEVEQAGADAWRAWCRARKDRISSEKGWEIWGDCRIAMGLD